MTTSRPTLWIIAGPNGVGKTTYAFKHIRAVSGSVHFINLDEIARGLSPLDPAAAKERAARVAIEQINWHLDRPGPVRPDDLELRKDFSIETTLSGRAHLGIIAKARAAGWKISLLYFAVDSVETCLARVARRVSEGGHDVPEADIRRRYTRSIRNLPTYIAAVDLWRIFDNRAQPTRVVVEGRQGCRSIMHDLSGLDAALSSMIDALPICAE